MNNCLKEFMAEHIRMPLLGYSAQGKTFSELSQDHQRIIRNKASFLTPETELADLVMPTEHLALRLNIREDLIVGAFDLTVAIAVNYITEGKAETFSTMLATYGGLHLYFAARDYVKSTYSKRKHANRLL